MHADWKKYPGIRLLEMLGDRRSSVEASARQVPYRADASRTAFRSVRIPAVIQARGAKISANPQKIEINMWGRM